MSEFGHDPEAEAAAAARNADTPPKIVINGTKIGECVECGERFLYGRGTDLDNFSDCPSCGTQKWGKWGYRYDGEDVHHSEVEWGGDSA